MKISAIEFSEKKCIPCEGGVPVIAPEWAAQYTDVLEGWVLAFDSKSITRKVETRNFAKAIELVNQIAELAESEQHHPDLHITGYRHLTIVLTTHAIDGLSENDFILAAKIDQRVHA